MFVDLFHTPERNNKALAGRTWDEYWADPANRGKVKHARIEVEDDADLADILDAYFTAGYPQGSSRGGVFEQLEQED